MSSSHLETCNLEVPPISYAVFPQLPTWAIAGYRGEILRMSCSSVETKVLLSLETEVFFSYPWGKVSHLSLFKLLIGSQLFHHLLASTRVPLLKAVVRNYIPPIHSMNFMEKKV